MLFSSQICNANTKKGVLTMEFPMTLWHAWMLQDLILISLSLVSHSLSLSRLCNNTQYNKSGTPSFASGIIFNNVLMVV